MECLHSHGNGSGLLPDAPLLPPPGARRVIKLSSGGWRAMPQAQAGPAAADCWTDRGVTTASTTRSGESWKETTLNTTGTDSRRPVPPPGPRMNRSVSEQTRAAREERVRRRLHKKRQEERVMQVGYDRLQQGRTVERTVLKAPSQAQIRLVAMGKSQQKSGVTPSKDASAHGAQAKGNLPPLPPPRRRSVAVEDTGVFEARLTRLQSHQRVGADVSAELLSNLLRGVTFAEVKDAWARHASNVEDDPVGAIDYARFRMFIKDLLGAPPISKDDVLGLFTWLLGLQDGMLRHSVFLLPVLRVRHPASLRGIEFFWYQFETRGRLHVAKLTNYNIRAFAAAYIPQHLLDAWGALARHLPHALVHYPHSAFPTLPVFAVWVFRLGSLHSQFSTVAPARPPSPKSPE
eukprot:TRINITY_DN18576_c0_g1_i1.p1 TRINITY_DN18576_c0_g1~~TRINITY_DN18576_c0_g1_i1.p1  ORF type:complete len:404 (+),score=76.26 TRINITY_DN18576_c0_g1_i1:42-1253(+)